MERENERYHMLQETGKLPPRRLDNGKPKLPDAARLNKKNAKKIKKSQKGVMGANNLFFQQEERDIYMNVYNEFKELIIQKRGEFTLTDEMLLKALCAVQIRFFRKTRMESSFNKFFDRVVPQDPIAQMQSLLKSLNLINDKTKDGGTTNKDLLSRLLSEESESSDKKELTLDEWQQAQESDEDIKLQLFTPKDATMFNTEFADQEEIPQDKLEG